MRIIDQNGCDYPYESIVISHGDGMIYARLVSNMEKQYFLARYSTKEKAEKAMQKLHEAYAPEPLFIHKDISPDERAAAGEISWAQALDEIHTGIFVRPISNSSIEQVYTGNIVFRFPREDEL